MKAFYAWQRRNSHLNEEQTNTTPEEGWRTVKQRIVQVGPLPRYVFDDGAFKARWEAIEAALSCRSDAAWKRFAKLLFAKVEWSDDGATHKLIKLVRVLWVGGNNRAVVLAAAAAAAAAGRRVSESSRNVPVAIEIEARLRRLVLKENFQMSALLSALGTCCLNAAAHLERLGCLAFLIGGVAEAVARKTKYIPRTAGGEPRASVLAEEHARGRFPRCSFLFEYTKRGPHEAEIQKVDLEPGVLYIPDTRLFPVLDAFYVAEVQPEAPPAEPGRARDTPTGDQSSAGKKMTLVGLQVTMQDTHDTTASKMALFMEYMRSNFNNWEVLKEAMGWEIIYIRHAESMPMTTRQRCTFTGQRSSDPQAPENFWERKVEQYQVQLDAEVAQLLVAANKRRLV
ncbi:putative retrotransposon hot spot (RHS) protein [Trypanosoma conorhini]|uniref:Putative retrotransposon hot spot (RHS) protein n=1 Tax=Trypanosoma conorhini TaxID=83891 RepID=A0A422N602_9TRYP|nr:putative retrotransposon hot spot (RHS) protein [Trypanosoma conorhini]RNF00862.1 putative retrotransposon hot spot (RHS) protein [Trypanosoma conorhini]